MSCRDIRNDLSAYLDDELSPERRERVSAHLESCADCRAELETLRRTVEMVSELPRANAPETLHDRVMGEIRSGAAPAAEEAPRVSAARHWWPVAAAILIAVGLMVMQQVHQRDDDAAPTVAMHERRAAETAEDIGRDRESLLEADEMKRAGKSLDEADVLKGDGGAEGRIGALRREDADGLRNRSIFAAPSEEADRELFEEKLGDATTDRVEKRGPGDAARAVGEEATPAADVAEDGQIMMDEQAELAADAESADKQRLARLANAPAVRWTIATPEPESAYRTVRAIVGRRTEPATALREKRFDAVPAFSMKAAEEPLRIVLDLNETEQAQLLHSLTETGLAPDRVEPLPTLNELKERMARDKTTDSFEPEERLAGESRDDRRGTFEALRLEERMNGEAARTSEGPATADMQTPSARAVRPPEEVEAKVETKTHVAREAEEPEALPRRVIVLDFVQLPPSDAAPAGDEADVEAQVE